MILCLLLLACTPDADCGVSSTISGYTPVCEEAELVYYTGETHFFLPGQGGTITAWLPETVEEATYGGESGNYLHVILDYDDGGSEQVQNTRGSTLTIGELSNTQALVRVSFAFDSGDVVGPVGAPVSDAR